MASQVAVEEPVPNVHGASPKRGRLRRQLYVTLPGCWGAVILAALSFTPTLLPRSGVIQGLVCGVTAAIGYGLGVLVAWVWRAFADREARTAKPSAWRGLAIGGGLLLVVSFALGQYWQHQIRDLMGVTEYNVALVRGDRPSSRSSCSPSCCSSVGPSAVSTDGSRACSAGWSARARPGDGVDAGVRHGVAARHRGAARRAGQCDGRGLRGEQHRDQTGQRPADQLVALRRARITRQLGLPGPGGS